MEKGHGVSGVFVKQLNRPMVTIIGRFLLIVSMRRHLRLPLTRELSAKLTEGENYLPIAFARGIFFLLQSFMFSPSVKNQRFLPPPSSEGGFDAVPKCIMRTTLKCVWKCALPQIGRVLSSVRRCVICGRCTLLLSASNDIGIYPYAPEGFLQSKQA